MSTAAENQDKIDEFQAPKNAEKEKEPWEFAADFKADMTLDLGSGESLSVNKHVLAAHSALVRDAPDLDEPFPMIVDVAPDALKFFLRLCYSRVMSPSEFSFPYDIFDIVSQIWGIAHFLQCDRILYDLRREMETACSELAKENFVTNKDGSLRVKYELAFSALLTMELCEKSVTWSEDALLIIHRCVNFGRAVCGRYGHSKNHAKRLSRPTLELLASKMAASCGSKSFASDSHW